MSQKHKVFLSFHHQDDYYRQKFEQYFSNYLDIFVNKSVKDGDIDPNNKTESIRRIIREKYISNTSVTIVLIGQNTWQRKHVDWEIAYSLTTSKINTRSGLLGILLPSYRQIICPQAIYRKVKNRGIYYTHCNIPPRLYDNVESGYTEIYSYPPSPYELAKWIHEAFERKKICTHKNSRDFFVKNRTNDYWQD